MAGCSGSGLNFLKFISNILLDSTIQGLKFIGSTGLRTIERIFWAVSVLTCIGLSVYLIAKIVNKFNANPVIISFQPEETTIQQIPFPAITLCNVNLMKRSEFSSIYDNLIRLVNSSINGKVEANPEVFQWSTVLEHLVQFCLTASSFQRNTGNFLSDAEGRPDFIEYVQDVLLQVNNSVLENYREYWESTAHKLVEAYNKTAINCQDMILQCTWSGKREPCNKIFFPMNTPDGRCCVFNMMPQFILQNISREEGRAKSEESKYEDETIKEWERFSLDHIIRDKGSPSDSTYPRYQTSGGKPYGLSILVNPELDEYSTCTSNDAYGFKIGAHSHLSLPSVREHGHAIPPTSEVFIEIDADVTDADSKAMRDIRIEARECYLPTDEESKLRHFNMYTADNCIAECIAQHTYLNCSCVRHFMPRNNNQSICGARDRVCAETVFYKIFAAVGDNDYCGHCRPSCTEIQYKMQVSHFDLRKEVLETPFAYNSYDGSIKKFELVFKAFNYSIIHVYFGMDTIYIKERKSLYNIWDLIGDAGSLLGLTLGISIVSFVEFIYFFTLRLYFKLQSLKEEKRLCPKKINVGKTISSIETYKSRSAITVSKPKAFSGHVIYPFIR